MLFSVINRGFIGSTSVVHHYFLILKLFARTNLFEQSFNLNNRSHVGHYVVMSYDT